MGNRWRLEHNAIVWDVTAGPHTDTLEMAGNQIAAIITYGVEEDGSLLLHRELRYPRLRTLPKDTSATLGCQHDEREAFYANGIAVREKPFCFRFDGVLTVCSRDENTGIEIVRQLFPSREKSAYIEHVILTNIGKLPATVSSQGVHNQSLKRGSKGIYPVSVSGRPFEAVLAPGESTASDLIFCARLPREETILLDGAKELTARMDFVQDIFERNLVLESSDEKLDCLFRFAKLRAAESIFDTAAGPLHSPGGGTYYAAVWTNDQIEYAAPFFPFLGYRRANTASINAFDLYIPFMGEDLHPIPSSIIDEGNDLWEGAGDRGDAAMYLYGLSRFLLAQGDRALAERYFDAIDWCVRYCRSRENRYGVIASDSDELEERFPSGDANLCTSSLTYGGLLSAADLAEELGKAEKWQEYLTFAAWLKERIEQFFGAEVSGYHTYRYYEGNEVLRSWICIPLTMGIMDRKEGTIAALLSDRLFHQDGLVCVEGDETFWDRSTLYAMRGILNAGRPNEVYSFLEYYCNKRLLTEHVPYPVEAYPEDNQRHLSAESALFARIVTEGLFGLTPRGLKKFSLCPALPEALTEMKLLRIRAFGSCFDLTVRRIAGCYQILLERGDGIRQRFETPVGDTVLISLE